MKKKGDKNVGGKKSNSRKAQERQSSICLKTITNSGIYRFTVQLIENQWTLLFIFLIGILLRSFAFGAIPPGLNQDEASVGYDAYVLLKYGIDRNGYHNPVHLVAWGSGQNALYAYFAMPFIQLFGLTPFSVRLPSLVFGIISLGLFYGLAKLCGSRRFALTAAFLITINPWHMMVSRWSLESNLFPFVFLIAVFILVCAIQKTKFYPLAAFIFGLSLYSYGTAYFVVPFFLLLTIPYLLVHKKISARQTLLSGLVFTVTSIPILLFILINKFKMEPMITSYLSIPRLTEPRFSVISSLFGDDFFRQSIKNFANFLKLLVVQNDGLPWNSIPQYGFMYLFSLPFVILGVWNAVLSFLQKHGSPHKNSREFNMNWILLAWLCSALVLGFVTEININRVNIVFLPLLFFLAKGIDLSMEKVKELSLPIIALYLASFLFFAHSYFTEYPARVSDAFYHGFGDAVSYAVNNSAIRDKIYVSNQVNMPYIYALFYGKVDPNSYLATVKYRNPGGAFQWVDSFDRYQFGIKPPAPAETAAYVLHNSELGYFSKDRFDIKAFSDYSVAFPKK